MSGRISSLLSLDASVSRLARGPNYQLVSKTIFFFAGHRTQHTGSKALGTVSLAVRRDAPCFSLLRCHSGIAQCSLRCRRSSIRMLRDLLFIGQYQIASSINGGEQLRISCRCMVRIKESQMRLGNPDFCHFSTPSSRVTDVLKSHPIHNCTWSPCTATLRATAGLWFTFYYHCTTRVDVLDE